MSWNGLGQRQSTGWPVDAWLKYREWERDQAPTNESQQGPDVPSGSLPDRTASPAYASCATCGGDGLVANGLPSNGPERCPDCNDPSGQESDALVDHLRGLVAAFEALPAPLRQAIVDADVERLAEALWRAHLPADLSWAEWEREAVLWKMHYRRRAQRAIAGGTLSRPDEAPESVHSGRTERP